MKMADAETVEEQLKLIFSEKGNSPFQLNENNVPSWYDGNKFKRGQQYFKNNFAGMMANKFYGMLCLLGVPEFVNWMKKTGLAKNMGPTTAFDRMRSVMCIFQTYYDTSFTPEHKSWQNLENTRHMLEISTKNGRKSELSDITQKVMAFMQFSCMGFILIRPHKFGISIENEADVEGFIHFWRVIGWLHGVDDRFNICRGSITETKELCEAFYRNIFAHTIKSKDPTFCHLKTTLFKSISFTAPLLDQRAVIRYFDKLSTPIVETDGAKKLDNIMEPYLQIITTCTNAEEYNAALGLYSSIIYAIIVLLNAACIKFGFFKTITNKFVQLLMYIFVSWPYVAYMGFFMVKKSKTFFSEKNKNS